LTTERPNRTLGVWHRRGIQRAGFAWFRRLGDSCLFSVNLATVSDSNDQNDKATIQKLGDHSMGADSVAPKTALSTQRFSKGSGIAVADNTILKKIANPEFYLRLQFPKFSSSRGFELNFPGHPRPHLHSESSFSRHEDPQRVSQPDKRLPDRPDSLQSTAEGRTLCSGRSRVRGDPAGFRSRGRGGSWLAYQCSQCIRCIRPY